MSSRASVVQGNPQSGIRRPARWLAKSLFGFVAIFNGAPAVLADVELQDYVPPKPGDTLRQAAIICCAALLATMPVVLWAVFFRKRRHRHHRHYPQRLAAAYTGQAPHLHGSTSNDEDGEPSTPDRRRRIWKRRRRREHRPLNPTLSQTGGLPPVRTQPPSEPLP